MNDWLQCLVEQGHKVLIVDTKEYDVIILSSTATQKRQKRKQNSRELIRTVLLALFAQKALVGDGPSNLHMKTLAHRTIQLRLCQEMAGKKFADTRRITPRKVGHIVRQELHLDARKDGSSQGRGRYAVVWDDEAMAQLREQFNITDQEISEAVAFFGERGQP